MNWLLFFLPLLVILSPLKAQFTVKGTVINELDIQYVELVVSTKPGIYNSSRTQPRIWLDFGRGLDTTQAGEVVKLVKGVAPVNFKSAIDALNYVYKNGWDLLYQYPLSQSNTYHYILRRRYPKNK